MPLYEYQCVKCHKKSEKIEKVDGPHLKKCPYCGSKVEPLISRSAIQFKGSGWYVTDYAGKKSAVESGTASSEKSETKDASGKDSPAKDAGSNDSSTKESKDSKETKESKPAPEKKTEKKKS